MMDYYLKAATFDALYKALEAAGVVVTTDDGWGVTNAHQFALDVVGAVYEPTGKMLTTEDGEVPAMRDVGGCHANLRVMDADGFDANKIAAITIAPPNTPVRSWA